MRAFVPCTTRTPHTSSRLVALSLLATVALSLPVVTAGCGEPEIIQNKPNDRVVRELTPELDHKVVVSTSVLRVVLDDDPVLANKTARVTIKGALDGGRPVDSELPIPVTWSEPLGKFVLDVPVSAGLWDQVNPSPTDTFTGDIELVVEDLFGPVVRGKLPDVLLFFTSVINPRVLVMDQFTEAWVGQRIGLGGDGFLRPEEGTTWAIVEEGTITYPDGSTADAAGRRAPLRWGGTRTMAYLPISPELFGVRPGAFAGTLRFVNELGEGGAAGSFDGPEKQRASFSLQKSFIASVEPPRGSRGQKIKIKGRGFLESDERAGYSMLLKFEGTFTPTAAPDTVIDFRGSRAITRLPLRVLDDATIEQDVWYTVNDDFTLSGLGSTPGQFDGRITPILVSGQDEQIGEPWQGVFEVLPTKQLVHVRFLPGFSEALERFGLRNLDADIRERVLQVLRRDYDGVYIEFVKEPPTEYVDYMTVEIGGPDPTGQGLFGYDNSFNGVPKDTGNLFLRDYLGGYNRQSQDAGFVPYGGVFIESFTIYSPKLSSANYETFPLFDELLAPFMPELGGTPVRATEWPDGARTTQIRDALLLIGNLAGHTASHEIGHSLGLPFFEGEDPEDPTYHNESGPKVYIMDPGSRRTFALRAELEENPPLRFSPTNISYLKRILPVPR